jgi:hypothetical protein
MRPGRKFANAGLVQPVDVECSVFNIRCLRNVGCFKCNIPTLAFPNALAAISSHPGAGTSPSWIKIRFATTMKTKDKARSPRSITASDVESSKAAAQSAARKAETARKVSAAAKSRFKVAKKSYKVARKEAKYAAKLAKRLRKKAEAGVALLAKKNKKKKAPKSARRSAKRSSSRRLTPRNSRRDAFVGATKDTAKPASSSQAAAAPSA